MAPGMGNAANESAKIAANLRQSVAHSRQLTFAVAGFGGQLGSAVGASAAIAENIAKASRNANIAASATGIGAVVAIIGTVIAATIGWRKETQEVANKVRDIKNETAQLEARAKGDRRLERELEITGAMDQQLDAAEKMEHFYRKFPELQEAIRRKAKAARDEFRAGVNRAYADEGFSIERNINPLRAGGTDAMREAFLRRRQLQLDFEQNLRNLQRNEQGYNPMQKYDLAQLYEEQFKSGMRDLERDLDAPARELGDSLGRSISGSIADGITEAIKNRSLTQGFKALTGGIIAGFGQMLQEIGTQSLLGAQLLKGIVDSFRAFAPEGAIGASLALIAFGGVLRGLGASMASGGAGGGGGRSVGSVGARAITGSFVSVGPATAAGGASAISSGGPTMVNFTLLGPRDPALQRQLREIVHGGAVRAGAAA